MAAGAGTQVGALVGLSVELQGTLLTEEGRHVAAVVGTLATAEVGTLVTREVDNPAEDTHNLLVAVLAFALSD